LSSFVCKGVGRKKIFQEGGPTEKRPKISKKYRNIALFACLFQAGGGEGGNEKKYRKIAIKAEKYHF